MEAHASYRRSDWEVNLARLIGLSLFALSSSLCHAPRLPLLRELSMSALDQSIDPLERFVGDRVLDSPSLGGRTTKKEAAIKILNPEMR